MIYRIHNTSFIVDRIKHILPSAIVHFHNESFPVSELCGSNGEESIMTIEYGITHHGGEGEFQTWEIRLVNKDVKIVSTYYANKDARTHADFTLDLISAISHGTVEL